MEKEYPSKLYRFERATKKRVETLMAGRIWASKPIHFNDLNDCQLNIDAYAPLHWNPGAAISAVEALYSVNPDELLPLRPEIVKTLRDALTLQGNDLHSTIVRAAVQVELRESIAESVAVCCFFGALRQSPLMWAHYGNNHKGLCVEYSVGDDPMDLHEVVYSSRRPRVTMAELLLAPWDTAIRVLRTKHLDWAYESEYRILVQGKAVREALDGLAIPLPAWLRPKAVIVGMRVESSLEVEGERPYENAARLAQSLNVPLCRVVRASDGLGTELLQRSG